MVTADDKGPLIVFATYLLLTTAVLTTLLKVFTRFTIFRAIHSDDWYAFASLVSQDLWSEQLDSDDLADWQPPRSSLSDKASQYSSKLRQDSVGVLSPLQSMRSMFSKRQVRLISQVGDKGLIRIH